MLKNLQKSVVSCLYKEHTFQRGKLMQNFLWMIYGIYFRQFLPNNASKFSRQMINCTRAWNYIQKASNFPLNIETIKQRHKIMMDKEKHQDGKDVLVGEYRKLSVFEGYHIFAPAGFIERHMEGSILGFMKLKKMIQLQSLQFFWKHYQYTSI